MMVDDQKILSERGRALEEEFFRKEDHRLTAKLRELKAKEASREELSRISGIKNTAILDRLPRLGRPRAPPTPRPPQERAVAPPGAEAPHRVDPHGSRHQREPDCRAGRGASRGPGRARPGRRACQRRRARGGQGLERGGEDDPPARVRVPHEVATRAVSDCATAGAGYRISLELRD